MMPKMGAVLLAATLLNLSAQSALSQSSIEVISSNRRGVTGEGPSQGPAISADGRFVAFLSDAIDLLPLNDRNGVRDVFLRDRAADQTVLISRARDGSEANGPSHPAGLASPAISADGCLVAFSSRASNLIENDGNGIEDIFVRDRCAERTERVSVGFDGGDPNGSSRDPDISSDGRYVVFQSLASNLVEGDTNGFSDIFVYDRDTGTTRRVSIADGTGEQGNGGSVIPAISGDGQVVAFESVATNLTGNADGKRHIFLHEIETGRTVLVSANASGTPGNLPSFGPDLDFDGSVVAFKSDASNLVPGDTNGVADTFVLDRDQMVIERVSVDDFGNQARSLSAHPSVSADGRWVVFPSSDDFLDPGDGNRQMDVFVVDRLGFAGNRIARVSVERFGQAEVGVPEVPPAISANGKWIAFVTASARFAPPETDQNNEFDVFVACNPLNGPCECLADEECPENQVCDLSTNTCVSPTHTPTPEETSTPTETPAPADTETPTNTPLATQSATPTPCSDELCPDGQVCDPTSNRCVTPTPTRAPQTPTRTPCTDACPDGLVCVDGLCVTPTPSETPNRPTPTRTPCTDACPDGLVCLDGVCVEPSPTPTTAAGGGGGGGGGGCNCEIHPGARAGVPDGLALLVPALLMWLRRRSAGRTGRA